MTIVGWILFAIINTIILASLEYDPEKVTPFQGFILGITGALSGSLFIYLMVNGMNREFAVTVSLVIVLEAFLLMTLLVTKSFKSFEI